MRIVRRAVGFKPAGKTSCMMAFSLGPSRMLPEMQLAPQELRTYFLTFVTAGRRRLFQTVTNASLLLRVLQENRLKGRFAVHAFVVMPDHIHLLLTPAPEVSLEKAMQFIKGGFSFRLKSKLDVWERGYNETRVLDAAAYEEFVRYIERNPVRAGIVREAEAYELSSARRAQEMDPRPVWFGGKRAQG